MKGLAFNNLFYIGSFLLFLLSVFELTNSKPTVNSKKKNNMQSLNDSAFEQPMSSLDEKTNQFYFIDSLNDDVEEINKKINYSDALGKNLESSQKYQKENIENLNKNKIKILETQETHDPIKKSAKITTDKMFENLIAIEENFMDFVDKVEKHKKDMCDSIKQEEDNGLGADLNIITNDTDDIADQICSCFENEAYIAACKEITINDEEDSDNACEQLFPKPSLFQCLKKKNVNFKKTLGTFENPQLNFHQL
ncbi:hypothetical protein GVAV_002596 [Gurleya vavrai]